jgi:hypothetical protein
VTARERYPRSRCCVPFCRRTSTLFPHEWVCGEHWRGVERSLNRFRTKRLKEIGRAIEAAHAATAVAQAALAAGGSEDAVWWAVDVEGRLRRRWRRVERSTWARMKRQAIERAGACG